MKLTVLFDQSQYTKRALAVTGIHWILLDSIMHQRQMMTAVQALPAEGKLVACERDLRPLKLAHQAFEKAGVADKVSRNCCRNCVPTCAMLVPASNGKSLAKLPGVKLTMFAAVQVAVSSLPMFPLLHPYQIDGTRTGQTGLHCAGDHY